MTKPLEKQKKPIRLITIPVSHYCEKARWAIARLNVPYIEEPHMPLFHRFATGRFGGKSVPVLVTEEGIFTDSTDILKYLDAIAPANAKLYPTDTNLLRQVKELEDLFNSQLGPATRCWGYSYSLNNYKLMQKRWSQGVPPVEQAFFPVVFPIMRSVARRSMNITPESGRKAYETVKSIFTQVSGLLADGRNYLVGDSLSAADLTFAALAAPAVMPPEHPMMSRSLQELPPKMASEIQAFRETPAGAYVLHLYRNRN